MRAVAIPALVEDGTADRDPSLAGFPQVTLVAQFVLLLYGLIYFLVSVLIAGVISIELGHNRHDARYCWWLWGSTTLVLALNCYWAYADQAACLAERRWTTAAFALVAVVPRGVLILLVCWVIRSRLSRNSS